MNKTFLSILAVSVLSATSVIAQDAPSGGPTIDGGVELNVEAGGDISAAIGEESTASQELGDINAGNITGDIE